jgi:excisionase family DNA binding protein
MGSRDRGRSPKPLLSVEDTAVLLGQSRSSIYRAIDRGDLPLPVFTINGRLRIPRRAVERLLDGDVAPRAAQSADRSLTASRRQTAQQGTPG